MYSTKYDTLIDEFPEETAAVGRLLELVRDAESRPGRKEYRANRLYDLLEPSNFRILVELLFSASKLGLLRQYFRVLSRTGTGIGDFDSVEEIPHEIYDSRIGQMIEVLPDDIELIFVIKS